MNTKTETYKKKIEEALSSIRPYLQADGGDIELVAVKDDMTVEVRLTGACNGCPMQLQTMKFGVEQAVKSAVPDVKAVVDINNPNI
jgi:Fe-S cluster biogenesis protein NfuA